jgi:hypothetical protein
MDSLDTARGARPGELVGPREQFPGFRSWREITGRRVRYDVLLGGKDCLAACRAPSIQGTVGSR